MALKSRRRRSKSELLTSSNQSLGIPAISQIPHRTDPFKSRQKPLKSLKPRRQRAQSLIPRQDDPVRSNDKVHWDGIIETFSHNHQRSMSQLLYKPTARFNHNRPHRRRQRLSFQQTNAIHERIVEADFLQKLQDQEFVLNHSKRDISADHHQSHSSSGAQAITTQSTYQMARSHKKPKQKWQIEQQTQERDRIATQWISDFERDSKFTFRTFEHFALSKLDSLAPHHGPPFVNLRVALSAYILQKLFRYQLPSIHPRLRSLLTTEIFESVYSNISQQSTKNNKYHMAQFYKSIPYFIIDKNLSKHGHFQQHQHHQGLSDLTFTSSATKQVKQHDGNHGTTTIMASQGNVHSKSTNEELTDLSQMDRKQRMDMIRGAFQAQQSFNEMLKFMKKSNSKRKVFIEWRTFSKLQSTKKREAIRLCRAIMLKWKRDDIISVFRGWNNVVQSEKWHYKQGAIAQLEKDLQTQNGYHQQAMREIQNSQSHIRSITSKLQQFNSMYNGSALAKYIMYPKRIESQRRLQRAQRRLRELKAGLSDLIGGYNVEVLYNEGAQRKSIANSTSNFTSNLTSNGTSNVTSNPPPNPQNSGNATNSVLQWDDEQVAIRWIRYQLQFIQIEQIKQRRAYQTRQQRERLRIEAEQRRNQNIENIDSSDFSDNEQHEHSKNTKISNIESGDDSDGTVVTSDSITESNGSKGDNLHNDDLHNLSDPNPSGNANGHDSNGTGTNHQNENDILNEPVIPNDPELEQYHRIEQVLEHILIDVRYTDFTHDFNGGTVWLLLFFYLFDGAGFDGLSQLNTLCDPSTSTNIRIDKVLTLFAKLVQDQNSRDRRRMNLFVNFGKMSSNGLGSTMINEESSNFMLILMLMLQRSNIELKNEDILLLKMRINAAMRQCSSMLSKVESNRKNETMFSKELALIDQVIDNVQRVKTRYTQSHHQWTQIRNRIQSRIIRQCHRYESGEIVSIRPPSLSHEVCSHTSCHGMKQQDAMM